jgi:hypothetical protein
LTNLKSQKVELSDIIVGSNFDVSELFGLDVRSLFIEDEKEAITKQTNEIIALLSEQLEKRNSLLEINSKKEIETKQKTFELESQKRKEAFEKELAEKAFTENEKIALQDAFNENEKVKLQLFEQEKLNIINSIDSKKLENQKKFQDERQKIEEDGLQKQRELNKQQIALFNILTNTTSDLFSDLGESLVQGNKDIKKILLKTLIDAFDAMIPALVLQITGISLAQPDSVASFGASGLLRAGILTALLKGLTSAAKAKIGGMHEGGLVGKSGDGSVGKNDTQLRWLDPKEFVLNRKAVSQIGVRNLQAMNRGYTPNVIIDNKHLIKEFQKAKLVQTEVQINVRDNTRNGFKIERVYR